jgi:hypothetical protein
LATLALPDFFDISLSSHETYCKDKFKNRCLDNVHCCVLTFFITFDRLKTIMVTKTIKRLNKTHFKIILSGLVLTAGWRSCHTMSATHRTNPPTNWNITKIVVLCALQFIPGNFEGKTLENNNSVFFLIFTSFYQSLD